MQIPIKEVENTKVKICTFVKNVAVAAYPRNIPAVILTVIGIKTFIFLK